MSGAFFQGDKDYCENTRAIDDMLETFKKDREKILELLYKDPKTLEKNLWSQRSPISRDDSCLFRMGESHKLSVDELLTKRKTTSDSMINFYICPQCKNMRRLIDFRQIKDGEPFMLECGEKAGKYLVYNQMNIINLHSVLEKEQFLNSDSFTNNMLINWYLQSVTKTPNISNMYISWICNRKGYNLFDYYEIENANTFQDFPKLLTNTGKPSPTAKADDKTPISRDVVMGIISQLFALLYEMENYNFSHGNPNTNALRFSKEPASYILDGYHVSCPVTLKMEDFENSGCTVGNIRLYSKSVVAEEEMRKRKKVDAYQEEGKTYQLKDPKKYPKSTILFMYMKNLGLIKSSFDAYAFMIVLMCERSFYSTVMSDRILSDFWKSMWVSEEDYEKVMKRIWGHHEKGSLVGANDILRILGTLHLRSDMIDFGWNNIKNKFE